MNWKHLARNQDTRALLLVVVMVVWFNHEMVWTSSLPFFRDLGPLFYPMRWILSESLRAGELPLWDPQVGMGYPLLANFQSGVFYPPNLVFIVLPFFAAVSAVFFIHYLIAATGFYLLCRHWKYPPFLAVIGTLLFTLGGTMVSLSNVMNHFQAAVWLPWVILLGERALRWRSWGRFLALTAVLLVQFLAGSPEIYAMSVALLFLDVVRLKAEGEDFSYRHALLVLMASNAFVVGLAMVQILPTAELVLESRVVRPNLYSESTEFSLHPWSLVNIFLLEKEVDSDVLVGLRPFFLKSIPFLVSHYMGALCLFGMFHWFVYGSWKERGIILGLILVSILLALGSYTPLYSVFFEYVPFSRLFRFPEKFFYLSHALLLVIVLRGLYHFFERDRSTAKRPLLVLTSVAALLLVPYVFLRFEMESLIRFVAWAAGTPPLFPATATNSSGILLFLERQIALVFGILLLLFLWKQGRLKTWLFQTLMIVIVFVDLSDAHQPHRYLLEPDFVFQQDKTIAKRDPEHHRLFYYPGPTNVHPSYYTITRQPPFPEFNSLAFRNLLPNTGVFQGFEYMQELDALMRWPYSVFLGVAPALSMEQLYRLLGALNVKYVSSLRSLPEEGSTQVGHFPEFPSWLYRIDRVIPRVYVVGHTMEEQYPAKALHLLASKEFDPLKTVILDRPLSLGESDAFQGAAEFTHYGNQNVKIHATLNGEGVLVLGDSIYPGWQVYVNGEERDIVRANLFFRGVPLSKGEHLVEFRYVPRSFFIGLWISLFSVVSVLAISILVYARSRAVRDATLQQV